MKFGLKMIVEGCGSDQLDYCKTMRPNISCIFVITSKQVFTVLADDG